MKFNYCLNILINKLKKNRKYLKCTNCECYRRPMKTKLKKCVCNNFKCIYHPQEHYLYEEHLQNVKTLL